MVTVNQIIRDIKTIKIQGATNVALAGIRAWELSRNKKSTTSKLIKARETEPMMRNCLKALNSKKFTPKELKEKIKQDKEKIRAYGLKALPKRKKLIVFTHCHSGTVTSILINARKKKKKIEVHNTETRPLYQGRITAKELLKAKLFSLLKQYKKEELESLKTKINTEPEWGSQIRSYDLHPYKMVKDHRTNVEIGDVNNVLSGELDELVEAQRKM